MNQENEPCSCHLYALSNIFLIMSACMCLKFTTFHIIKSLGRHIIQYSAFMYNPIFTVHSAMNDLLQTMAVAGGPGAQWVGSTENLDGPEAGDGSITGRSRRSGQRMKELALSTNAIDCATLTLPSAGRSRSKLRLQVKGQGALICLVLTLPM